MSPATVIEKANARARVKPQLDAYVNGEHRYTFEAGNLYPIYAAKGRVTTLLLEPGEEISENGFYAADLQNWQYEPGGVMGHGPDERPVVVIMPYHAGIRTNLSVATNRRLYLLELRAFNTTYMPAVSWHYPERDHEQRLSQWREQQSQRRLMQAPRIHPEHIRTPYTLKAVKAKKGLPEWMPREAMHDGRRTYITFAPEVTDTPALFVRGSEGLEVVQFRIRTNSDGGMTYIVDQVLDQAELRLIHGEQANSPGARVLIEIDPKLTGKADQ
jgi:type IV secretion system protein VirB9